MGGKLALAEAIVFRQKPLNTQFDLDSYIETAKIKLQLEAAEVQRAEEVAELNTKLEASMKEIADLKQLLQEGGILQTAEAVKEKQIQAKDAFAQQEAELAELRKQ